MNPVIVDTDRFYPDPQNLMNPDPVQIQVNKIAKLISKHLIKVKKKYLFSSLTKKP